jgi:predicted GNAT superfamily acetyltransferase
LDIRPLQGEAEYRACVSLQELTWGPDFTEAVPPTLLRLVQQMGGIASGAFDADGRLLGFVFGITGWVGGQPVHWSDMLAVHPDARDRGIGERLKRHQRDLLLRAGVRLARWTFDPLEARNARLNLSILGATTGTYVRDFYGESVSALHQGIGTDRLIMDWRLDSPRVMRRLDGLDRPPAPADLVGIPIVNPVRAALGSISCDDARSDIVADRLLLAVPSSIQAVKREAPEAARRWRRVTRIAFEWYLERGYRVTEFVRADACGLYLLEAEASED